VQANIGMKLNATADLEDSKNYRYGGKRIKFEDGKVTEIQ
jgi:hypothetical protein